MVTFSIFLDALTNPQKGNIPQLTLASAFEVSTSTVNDWIKKGYTPRKDAHTLSQSITEDQESFFPNQNSSDFIAKIINYMDIPDIEKEYLNNKHFMYQQQYPSPDISSQEFLAYLIDIALKKKHLDVNLPYDCSNPTRPIIGVGGQHILAVRKDGIVLATGANDFQQSSVHAWRDVVSVSAGWRSSIGLKADGTCVAVGENMAGNGEIFHWTSIVSVCCGTFHTLGLKRNGTVVSYGMGGDGQCEVSEWKNIRALAAGTSHSVGLCSSGKVVACGSNREGQCEVSSWENVVRVAAAGEHTVGLTGDGKILFAGDRCTFDFSAWNDITAIATGLFHVVGLKKDGTVLHTGHTAAGQDCVYKWWDIKAIYAGYHTTAGLQSDGTVVVTNDRHSQYFYNTSSWKLLGRKEQENKSESPFEIHRKNLISVCETAHDLALKLSPALRETIIDSDSEALLLSLYELSKKTFDQRDKIDHIKPLADLSLLYNAAFCDFYETFVRNTDQVCPGSNSYEACITFLTVIKSILLDVRSL